MKYQTDTASTSTGDTLPKKWWMLGLGAILLCSALVSGCGSGSDSSTTPLALQNETGDIALSLTDEEGDFLTYTVTVNSIELTRQDGAAVEVLPISTTIDFAQYVEVSELLTMATVPAGVYTAIELNLDYSNAEVVVQAENGEPITASLIDSNGNPLEQLSVSLQLASGSEFTIKPGIAAQVTLDLDLDASNSVSIIGNEATVAVEPILIADTQFENPKSIRLRGLLDTVYPDDNLFVLNIRPFRHRQNNFGSIRVKVDDQTRYEIDGVAYDADTGFTQLASLDELTPIISLGEWNRETSQYTANIVLAGSSVPWGQADALRGVVIDREGNSLTIRGTVIELANSSYRFNDDVTLIVADTTTVTQQLQGLGNSSIADISIGSAIRATGELLDDSTLDASEGHLRIHLNNITGSVVAVSPLNVDLQRLSGRYPKLYDFSGTGSDASTDADPKHYEVDTGALQLNNINLGDPIKVRGLVSPFGTAPEDFVAQTVFDASNIKAHMVINYGTMGAQTAIAQATNEMLVFDLSDSDTRHHVIRAGILTDLEDFESMPIVIPAEQTGIFAITRRGRIEIYRNFDDFVTTLNEALAAGELITRFDAHGHFDNSEVQMSSKRLRVGLTR